MSTTSKHRFQTLKLLDGCIQMLPSNKYYVVYTSRKVLKFVIKHNFLCKTDSTMLYLGWSTHWRDNQLGKWESIDQPTGSKSD